MTPAQRRQAYGVEHPWLGSAGILVVTCLPMMAIASAMSGSLLPALVGAVTAVALYPWLVRRFKREKLSQDPAYEGDVLRR